MNNNADNDKNKTENLTITELRGKYFREREKMTPPKSFEQLM